MFKRLRVSLWLKGETIDPCPNDLQIKLTPEPPTTASILGDKSDIPPVKISKAQSKEQKSKS